MVKYRSQIWSCGRTTVSNVEQDLTILWLQLLEQQKLVQSITYFLTVYLSINLSVADYIVFSSFSNAYFGNTKSYFLNVAVLVLLMSRSKSIECCLENSKFWILVMLFIFSAFFLNFLFKKMALCSWKIRIPYFVFCTLTEIYVTLIEKACKKKFTNLNKNCNNWNPDPCERGGLTKGSVDPASELRISF